MKNKITQLDTLTGIRFYAAMHVVLFHNLYLFGDFAEKIPIPVLNFISKGELAVSFFFILSGFILSYAYQDKINTKKEKVKFLVARFAKLYPLYFLALILDAPRVISYFFEKYDQNQASFKVLLSFFSSLLMIQSWFPPVTATWNSPAWSLSTEIFFYISFVFIFKYLNKSKYSYVYLFLSIATPVIVYQFFQFLNLPLESNFMKIFWRSFPPLRVFEFILGIILFNYFHSGARLGRLIKNNSNLLFWFSVAASIYISSTQWSIQNKEIATVATTCLFSIMILSSSYGEIRWSKLLNSKLVLTLGMSSYAIYIIHQPFKYYLESLITKSAIGGLTYCLSLISLSIILNRHFEIPLQKRINNYLIIKNEK